MCPIVRLCVCETEKGRKMMVFFGLYGVSIGFGCMRTPCHNSGGVVVVAISFRSVLFVSYV